MTLTFQRIALAAGVSAALAASGFASAQEITGAGASFPAPIYSKWASDYNKATGVKVNYQSIGSGGGIKQITAKTVDFGASDMPLTDEELAKDGLIQFPTVIGGVVPVVNIKGIQSGQIKLTGQVLGDIYLGKIAKWNDPKITALNPGKTLPDQAITVVHRADGSGTTFNFTDYLSAVSKDWADKVGKGAAVKWPADSSVGGKGNEGVAANVNRVKGAVGYVEYAYVKKNNMNFLQLLNASGKYVSPDDLTFAAAAAGADWFSVPGMGVSMVNAKGNDSWPISTASFILMYKKPADKASSDEVLKFFDWAFKNGKKMASELDYVPLPDSLTAQIRSKVWTEIK